MGIPVLILGESGTGKTTSLRNFNEEEISFINVEQKQLPFKKKFKKVISTDNASKIIEATKRATSKILVIDDAQYIMANEYMRRSKEKGYDKFAEIGSNFFNLVESVKALPADSIVYFLMHTEETQLGSVKAKTIGKMLDSTITLEGKFTIVLRTLVEDGKYYFSTQNSGNDTVKSPIGMFKTSKIKNDLKEVTNIIKDYYEL